MAKSKDWIRDAIGKPGVLHRALHVTAGQPIPRAKLEEAARKPGVTGQRARLALTLRTLNKD